MNVFLTGASGFVGSHIAEHLVASDGHTVLCSRREGSDLWRCRDFMDKVRWISTDDPCWMDEAIAFRPQAIINAAWDGVGAAGRGDWDKQLTNLGFQQDLLSVVEESRCEKFIGIGSQAEYGEFSGCIDEQWPARPASAYGAVKLASLDVLRAFCELHGIRWFWFRLFSGFGEREGDGWLIPSTIRNMLRERSMDITPGEQKYAYLYIGEVAKAITAALTTSAESGIYNLSSDRAISIRELLEKIKSRVNPAFELRFGALPYRAGQSMWMQGDNSKLRTEIYPVDSGGFEEKLDLTINYYKALYKRGQL